MPSGVIASTWIFPIGRAACFSLRFVVFCWVFEIPSAVLLARGKLANANNSQDLAVLGGRGCLLE